MWKTLLAACPTSSCLMNQPYCSDQQFKLGKMTNLKYLASLLLLKLEVTLGGTFGQSKQRSLVGFTRKLTFLKVTFLYSVLKSELMLPLKTYNEQNIRILKKDCMFFTNFFYCLGLPGSTEHFTASYEGRVGHSN